MGHPPHECRRHQNLGPGEGAGGCMKSDEPGRVNSLRERKANAVRPEGEERPKIVFRERLKRWLSCPELAKDFDSSAEGLERSGRARPPKPKWPEPKGRAPIIGNARNVTVQSANYFCAVSFRIADYGLLMEFSLRIWDYRIRLTCDDLTSDSWLFRHRPNSDA